VEGEIRDEGVGEEWPCREEVEDEESEADRGNATHLIKSGEIEKEGPVQ
jgi:hypothetical protein